MSYVSSYYRTLHMGTPYSCSLLLFSLHDSCTDLESVTLYTNLLKMFFGSFLCASFCTCYKNIVTSTLDILSGFGHSVSSSLKIENVNPEMVKEFLFLINLICKIIVMLLYNHI